MAQENKYLGESGLPTLIQIIKDGFAKIKHTHTKSEISDFPTDFGGTTITKSNTEPTDGADFWLQKY